MSHRSEGPGPPPPSSLPERWKFLVGLGRALRCHWCQAQRNEFGVGQKYEERELRIVRDGWLRTVSDEPVSGWRGG